MNDKIIDIKKKVEDIRAMYQKDRNDSFSCIAMGLVGVGKTSLIGTGRRPILIYSFDPKGTLVLEQLYPDEIKNGNILIRKYWNEKSTDPTMYMKFEEDWNEDTKSGFLNNFGTCAVDSLTTYLEALSNYVSKKRHRRWQVEKGKDPFLAQQDYVPIYNTVKDMIKESSSYDCDFILTAHLMTYQDDLTKEVSIVIDTYSRLQSSIPILFSEKYVLTVKDMGGKPVYSLLTNVKGRFKASTQLGAGGKFKREEEPDIKALLRKAGLSDKDKPSLFK